MFVEPGFDALLGRIAERHHSVYAARHLDELGVNANVRKHRLATGRWVVVHDGVYRIAGLPLSWRGSLLAACWAGDPDTLASHRSAAELWQLPGRSIDGL